MAGGGGVSLALALAERFASTLRGWREIRLRFCPLPVSMVLLALALGSLRLDLAQPAFTPADLAWYNHRGTAVITATITPPPKLGQRSTPLILAASQISLLDGNGIPVETLTVHGTLAGRRQAGLRRAVDAWQPESAHPQRHGGEVHPVCRTPVGQLAPAGRW